MKSMYARGALLAAVLLSGNAFSAELETDAQKLGYIIGMDIGSSLKQQGGEHRSRYPDRRHPGDLQRRAAGHDA